VRLEIFPDDRQPAFSATAIWEIMPAAGGAVRAGALLRVTIDRENLRRVFPEIAGVDYSQRFQDRLLFIENDFPPAAPGLAPEAPKRNTIYRKRSKTVLFGLPLWEAAFNVVNKNGRHRHVKAARARAVIAVGDSATGVVAIGGFAKGVVAIGHFSFGVVSCGTFAVGLLGIGLFGVGLLAAGLISGGLASAGGLAGGFAAVGLLVAAPYGFSLAFQSPEMLAAYELLKFFSGLSDRALDYTVGYAATAYFFSCWIAFILSFVARILLVRHLRPNDNRLESPRSI
jgi:hypothetical protein